MAAQSTNRYLRSDEVKWYSDQAMSCDCRQDGIDEDRLNKTRVNIRRRLLEGPGQDRTTEIRIWHDIVQRYSRNNLTVESDRLPALSGSAKGFRSDFTKQYVAGC